MKKKFVLFFLFIFPIVAYLFFATGVNHYTKLPILTPKLPELGNWASLDNQKVGLTDKITILGFGGRDILKHRGNIANLNEKIYKEFYKFRDMQFVMICPIESESDVKKIVDALTPSTDMSRWKFVFAPTTDIQQYFSKMELRKDKLNADYGSSKVYIVDKERNLRGRKLQNDKDYKEGYDTFHMSELYNEMTDDVKIILYDYRAALKKNHNATKQVIPD
jgi:hypothetical protein